jgi:hypothetical protein
MVDRESRGQVFVKCALAAGAACFALANAATIAQATTLNETVNVSIYQSETNSNNINDPTQQAQQGNPLIAPAYFLGSGTYSGPLDFNPSTNTIGAFFTSGGGSTTGLSAGTLAAGLSSAPFGLTTVMVITGTTAGTISGTIEHDDGASLYYGVGFADIAMFQPGPVSATVNSYDPFKGPWQLIYVEANGLPAVLDFEVLSGNANPTPLPAALPLFATGLGVLGLFGRRKKRKIAAA